MTKIKNIQLNTILYWLTRIFSVVLSSTVIIFLLNAINHGISAGSFVALLLFSLFFIVPGISIFIIPKISIWIYSVLEILLILSVIYNFSHWTIILMPAWVLAIILLLIYELQKNKKG